MLQNGIKKNRAAQLELSIDRPFEVDRNFDKGGRSFYFFDFDDNVAVLSTSIILFHKTTKREIKLSTRDFGEQSGDIGKRGIYKDYDVNLDDQNGSFRNFRDKNLSWIEKLVGRRQIFVEDLAQALGFESFHWQGPSWNCFYHAVLNNRPTSLITARGHDPLTIQHGIKLMVRNKHIPKEPNYLAIYPINHSRTRNLLGKGPEVSVAEMKQAAIRASVAKAFADYGFNEHHRFGMSDDDPKNIELILQEMAKLKKDYPRNSFFVFDTYKGQFLRREVFDGHTIDHVLGRPPTQLKLF